MKNHNWLHLSLFSFATIATASSAAWAGPAVSDGEAPSTVVKGPAAPVPAASDPNIDRGFLLPTAMTQPARSLTYNNYELLLHGFTYGITDRVQTSVTVLSPIVRDMPLLGLASAKWQFVSTPHLHLAVQGSAGMLHEFAQNDVSGTTAYTLGAGVLASFCPREDCATLLSASATYQAGFGANQDQASHSVIYGGSIVQRISPHVKLLGEVASLVVRNPSSENDFSNAPGLVANYGVRFHTGSIACDIGFMKPIFTDFFAGGDGNNRSDDPFLLGLPFVNVSYRW